MVSTQMCTNKTVNDGNSKIYNYYHLDKKFVKMNFDAGLQVYNVILLLFLFFFLHFDITSYILLVSGTCFGTIATVHT